MVEMVPYSLWFMKRHVLSYTEAPNPVPSSAFADWVYDFGILVCKALTPQIKIAEYFVDNCDK